MRFQAYLPERTCLNFRGKVCRETSGLVTASAKGFRTTSITNLEVQVNTSATVNVKLTLGETNLRI
jgi:hypothetical protein